MWQAEKSCRSGLRTGFKKYFCNLTGMGGIQNTNQNRYKRVYFFMSGCILDIRERSYLMKNEQWFFNRRFCIFLAGWVVAILIVLYLAGSKYRKGLWRLFVLLTSDRQFWSGFGTIMAAVIIVDLLLLLLYAHVSQPKLSRSNRCPTCGQVLPKGHWITRKSESVPPCFSWTLLSLVGFSFIKLHDIFVKWPIFTS